jgi:caffeoyl-CoA O-methyltransferase
VSELISETADAYAAAHTKPFTGQLAEVAAWTRDNTDAPQMMAGLAEARLLQALIVAGGARRVLEIGTFTGLGALAMAEALPEGGQLITLEVDHDRAARAREFFADSPYGERITLIEGSALETLADIDGPFDLVWIDAWKADYPAYYDLVIDKLADRGVIAADNMFRSGSVLDADADDEGVIGLREFADRVQADDRVSNVMLTVGDGVMLAWRRPG